LQNRDKMVTKTTANHKLYKFEQFRVSMPRKKKKSVVHKPLNEFYTEEQRKELALHKKREHHRKTQEQIEADIFEHIKEHTKKVLKQQNSTHL